MRGRRRFARPSRFPLSLLLAGFAASMGCTSFQEVTNVSRLRPEEKVVVGNIVVVGNAADWAPGILAHANLIFDYELPPQSGDQIYVQDGDGYAVVRADRSSAVDTTGGAFHVGVRNQPVYILGIRVDSSVVVMHVTTTFPVLVRIAPSPNKCEYIGTIGLRRQGDDFFADIFDEYDKYKTAYAATTEGCDLKKNLATKVVPAPVRR